MKHLLSARLTAVLVVAFSLILFLSSRSDHRLDSTQTAQPGSVARRTIAADQSLSASLLHRDDGSCSATQPCPNGACCGQSGYCGYGSQYCGTGCQSNCNATAECGQYSSPPGQTCPLNTCCSQFGFCGTTTDFCTNGCQSNCIEDPAPSGAKGSSVLNRVVGYYESWSARSSCHAVQASDLPLDVLTHINFAFASIDPSTFNVVTMDGATPESLFSDVTSVKQINPDLKVFVSIGGWSFSDNGTATQPIFGNIAASAANRKQFANNVLNFMNQHGFDGLDIDWEYPGAPDRGGSPQDTQNFVLLLEDLHSTFSSSPRSLGLTFTAPSSYWYLRWFNLPDMLKYADWVNVMTYDLHGVWDSSDPIGSIVQGHTNLTEIKLAMELFWRVNVPPAQISMGFGFYGRSFQLADPTCTTPGCPFKGGARPGPCSGTSGILAYYEIQALLNQNPSLTPVHDQEAAVKYLVFDNDQWVSYDDADTFKQKVDWANSVGLNGALIWASDLDDDQYSAHAGLIGTSGTTTTLQHSNLKTPSFGANKAAIASNMRGQSGQSCSIQSQCVTVTANAASTYGCPSGQVRIGWESTNCQQDTSHAICCPSNETPSQCFWRGDGPMCLYNKCNVGEERLFSSAVGGDLPSKAVQCSYPGTKNFCCQAPDYAETLRGCRWTDCQLLYEGCNSDETQVAEKDIGYPACQPQGTSAGQNREAARLLCCKAPVRLQNCQWKGTAPSCSDAICPIGQVEIDQNLYGQSTDGGKAACGSLNGEKALCCDFTQPPPAVLDCSANPCDDDPDVCDNDEADDNPYDLLPSSFGIVARSVFENVTYDKEESEGLFPRGRQGKGRTYHSDWPRTPLGRARRITWNLASYVTGPYIFRGVQQRVVPHIMLRLRNRSCRDTQVETAPVDTNAVPSNGQTEHPIDGQVIRRFGEFCLSGQFENGTASETGALNNAFMEGTEAGDFGGTSLPVGLPPIGNGQASSRVPTERIMECFGSTQNADPFLLADAAINGAKGALMRMASPISGSTLRSRVQDAINDLTAENVERMFSWIRAGIAVFSYVQQADYLERANLVRDCIVEQTTYTEDYTAGRATGLTQAWREFWPGHLRLVQRFAQNWATDSLRIVEQVFANNPTVDFTWRTLVRQTIADLRQQIPNMVFPHEMYQFGDNGEGPSNSGGSR